MSKTNRNGRMINQAISDSNSFSKLSPEAAVLFCMMIPHYNSYGKMNGGAGYIKDVVCPKVPYLTIHNIPDLLKEISEHTDVKYFEYNKRWWIHATKFNTHHQNLRPDRLGHDNFPSFEQKDNSLNEELNKIYDND